MFLVIVMIRRKVAFQVFIYICRIKSVLRFEITVWMPFVKNSHARTFFWVGITDRGIKFLGAAGAKYMIDSFNRIFAWMVNEISNSWLVFRY